MSEQFSGKHEFYPARSGGPNREISVTAPNPDSYIGQHPSQQMLDDVITLIRVEIPIPAQLHRIVDANVVLVPGGTGNLACIALTDYGRICSDEAYNAHDGSIDYTIGDAIAVTQNEFECIDVSDALINVEGSDWVGLTFIRSGAEATDTVNAKVDLLGVRVRYV